LSVIGDGVRDADVRFAALPAFAVGTIKSRDFAGRKTPIGIEYYPGRVRGMGGFGLKRRCACGRPMEIRLRTVIYRGMIEIENVPVFCCEHCSRTELAPGVKSGLAELIRGQERYGSRRARLRMDEHNEFARLLVCLAERPGDDVSLDDLAERRIDELLDLLLLVRSLGDEAWLGDIRRRLSQLACGTRRV